MFTYYRTAIQLKYQNAQLKSSVKLKYEKDKIMILNGAGVPTSIVHNNFCVKHKHAMFEFFMFFMYFFTVEYLNVIH